MCHDYQRYFTNLLMVHRIHFTVSIKLSSSDFTRIDARISFGVILVNNDNAYKCCLGNKRFM